MNRPKIVVNRRNIDLNEMGANEPCFVIHDPVHPQPIEASRIRLTGELVCDVGNRLHGAYSVWFEADTYEILPIEK